MLPPSSVNLRVFHICGHPRPLPLTAHGRSGASGVAAEESGAAGGSFSGSWNFMPCCPLPSFPFIAHPAAVHLFVSTLLHLHQAMSRSVFLLDVPHTRSVTSTSPSPSPFPTFSVIPVMHLCPAQSLWKQEAHASPFSAPHGFGRQSIGAETRQNRDEDKSEEEEDVVPMDVDSPHMQEQEDTLLYRTSTTVPITAGGWEQLAAAAPAHLDSLLPAASASAPRARRGVAVESEDRAHARPCLPRLRRLHASRTRSAAPPPCCGIHDPASALHAPCGWGATLLPLWRMRIEDSPAPIPPATPAQGVSDAERRAPSPPRRSRLCKRHATPSVAWGCCLLSWGAHQGSGGCADSDAHPAGESALHGGGAEEAAGQHACAQSGERLDGDEGRMEFYAGGENDEVQEKGRERERVGEDAAQRAREREVHVPVEAESASGGAGGSFPTRLPELEKESTGTGRRYCGARRDGRRHARQARPPTPTPTAEENGPEHEVSIDPAPACRSRRRKPIAESELEADDAPPSPLHPPSPSAGTRALPSRRATPSPLLRLSAARANRRLLLSKHCGCMPKCGAHERTAGAQNAGPQARAGRGRGGGPTRYDRGCGHGCACAEGGVKPVKEEEVEPVLEVPAGQAKMAAAAPVLPVPAAPKARAMRKGAVPASAQAVLEVGETDNTPGEECEEVKVRVSRSWKVKEVVEPEVGVTLPRTRT
ncbi:hypothetical protein FB451DRAFT_1390992 [Mycena latifolia]|nr:hypothetical protein FB451DRAFT_1390992 [Mycena latifolia]